ncbi:4'-phosphopantetheinyl transferase superfamily protein [Streptomyces sp. Pv4-95]|uniref:4'-phosphopantetheinyl transferase family protein n=1 Tax=Streptomyces sp. Pv4-95 TaxID=3049543 RepID=UPI0038928B4E
MREGFQRDGNVVAYTTSGEWLSAVTTDPRMRQVLGRDRQRYRDATEPVVRHRFAARLALKYTAAAALGTEAVELDLAYKTGGRPHLRGLRHVDVSLTHTGEFVAVGVSRLGRIGVDAEPLSRALSFDVLLDRVCTPAERAVLQALDVPDRRAAMLRLWTLKESYTKALGQGLRLRFTDFDLSACIERDVPEAHGTGLLAPDGTPAVRGAWGFGTYRALRRWLISVACHAHGPAPGAAAHGIADDRSMALVSGLLSGDPHPSHEGVGPAQGPPQGLKAWGSTGGPRTR